MDWSNKEWGSLLIGAGVILIILATPLNSLFATIDVNVFGIQAGAEGISPYSATALIGGVILIGAGIYLRKK